MDFDSFEEAALAIANLGGDADTNAAIFGQLGGAYYGIEAIPARWKQTLHEGSQIDALAARLLATSISEKAVTRFEEDQPGTCR
ncbi:ADP-ribosylglycohydrolase family protein [Schaalia vaccimaxillae]|uniref:ADP-ribosylglycohydrolase family protein n=1 Tax=Schaalia vaccimaxillae TaxID=183916 RepID=UPI0003F54B0F